MKKLSFIGAGNMGGAIIKALCSTDLASMLTITDYNQEKASEMAQQLGCHVAADNNEAAQHGDFVFLCVKPQVMRGVVEGISETLNARIAAGERPALVSIAAGLRIDALRSFLKGACAELPIIRLMPNTPVTIGKGMTALACDEALVLDGTVETLSSILSPTGRCERLPESLFDAFTAVASCGPAFAYQLIEALADGGVLAGLPRAAAMTYAAQMLLGSAAMVLETGTHPAALKDAVCSPGGATIAGVAALEKNGFRNAAIEAIVASYKKTKQLG